MPEREEVDRIARAICREKCAFLGEPPCDEPGCMALATAAAAALRSPEDSEGA